jgi:hypothetical protein
MTKFTLINSSNDERLARLRLLADWLDTRFKGPFGIRFGLDPLIGLVPFLGDLITTIISAYILIEASKLGCSPAILARMGINVAIENLLGQLPLLGAIFDFLWRANDKNLRLIEAHEINPARVTWRSRLFVGVILVALLSIVVLAAVGTFYLLSLILDKLTG